MGVDETQFVTVTAKDVYGNVVPSMDLTVTYTGSNARIVSFNGAQSNTARTDAKGLLVVGILADKAGAGTLKIETTSGVAVTTTTTSQGVAPISRVGDVSVSVTSTGVSAVQAAADAATDAAAEAIDAANAATDAANLAAEAADAATVAAEEARDAADAATAAVEELATQVATLMAALKAQITTLANTVAKIAKKVKA
jgi:ABC-type transporter Mla subunit MlaD